MGWPLPPLTLGIPLPQILNREILLSTRTLSQVEKKGCLAILYLVADLSFLLGQVIPDSDAHRAGLQEGDQVLAVNDVDFQDIEHSKVRVAGGGCPPGCWNEEVVLWVFSPQEVPDALSAQPTPEGTVTVESGKRETEGGGLGS